MWSKGFFVSLCSLAALFDGAMSASSRYQKVSTYEAIRAAPEGWSVSNRAAAESYVHLKIAMKPSKWEEFEKHAINIATPGHPAYGQLMSRDAVKEWVRPSAEATETVMGWLKEAQISNIKEDGDWIHFSAPVDKAEALLNTNFNVYTNANTGAQRIRTLSYAVPIEVQQHINMVQPTTRFHSHGQMPPRFQTEQVLTEHLLRQQSPPAREGAVSPICNSFITPSCLRTLYNVGDYVPNATNGNKLGIAGFLEEYAKYADLKTFTSRYASYAKDANFTFVGVSGGVNEQSKDNNDSVEANLDMQYAVAMSNPVPITYYQTAGRPPFVPDLDVPGPKDTNEPYLDWVNYLLALPDNELPQVITHSYGENEQSVPENYAQSVCQAFAQLGARGSSIIFSSGDTGVGSACQTNDGKNTTRFLPTFPAACPWVTSVGGTHRVQPESAVSFSSGGFSDRYAIPEWQKSAVSTYLQKLGNKWEGLYNPTGRGFPDVAAQAQGFQVYDKGLLTSVGGTSAAGPVFAALVAMLNSARIDAKKPVLGFLNPWLYSVGKDGLNDIVNGGSNGCTGEDYYSHLETPHVPYASWNATPGWDPVTGLGTPNFQSLLKIALA